MSPRSDLIALARRHGSPAGRAVLLITLFAGLCGGGLVVAGLTAVGQTNTPQLSFLLLFGLALAALAAAIGALIPRLDQLVGDLVGALRAKALSAVVLDDLDAATAAFERLPAAIARGLAAAAVSLAAGAALLAAVIYLLATHRPLGALVLGALAVAVGLQLWSQVRMSGGSLAPAALERLRLAQAQARFSPASAAATGNDVLLGFEGFDRATAQQAAAAVRARLIDLSLVCLLIGAALYMAYAGKLADATLAETLARLLIATPLAVLLSGRVGELWTGEQAARAWVRLEGRLAPAPAAAHASAAFAGLRLEAVRYGGPERTLGPVDLNIEASTVTVLLGERGAGKSALLDLLGGVTPARDGRVLLGGVQLGADEAARTLRRQAVSLTGRALPALIPLDEAQSGEAAALLTALGLDARFLSPSGLAATGGSSGEAARLALAAAILDPRLLVLIDSAAIADLELRTALARDWAPRLKARGRAVVIATDDPQLGAIADLAIRLESGGTIAPMGTGGATP